MASLRQIRRRMKSIENIHEITKAMEMIAAFRFKRAENRFSKAKPFFAEMEKMISNLSSAAGKLSEPLFEARDVRKKTLVVMTGDKGLCGAHNTNILRAAGEWVKKNASHGPSLVTVGKVGTDWFRKKHATLLAAYPEKAPVDAALAKKATEDLKRFYLERKTDAVEILYSAYRAGTAGYPVFEPLLGLSYLMKSGEASSSVEYIYEPDFPGVFTSLLSRYLEGKIFIRLLESLTSEYSARMIAMKQATENGEEVLDSLRLLRNKTRQATITRELTEIVSGANALN